MVHLMHRYSIAILTVLLAVMQRGFAQDVPQSRIVVRSEVQPQRIMLRWAASDASAWLLLNRYGVQLERLTVVRDGIALDEPELRVLASDLRPRESDKLKRLAQQHDMAAVVAQGIFGDSFEVSMGSSPVARAIARSKEEQQRFVFSLYAADLCFPMAVAVGWGWVDTTVRVNERYLYRVMPLVPSELHHIEPGAALVVPTELTRLVPPIGLSAQFGEAGAMLSWDFASLQHLYCAYMVERSHDGQSFAPVSQQPITQIANAALSPDAPATFVDSLPQGQTVHYRLVGITPFGSRSQPSAVVSGMAASTLKQPPAFVQATPDAHGGAMLEWQFPEADQQHISGFSLLRSTNNKHYAPAVQGLPAHQRSFHVEQLGQHIYYKVEAQLKQGGAMQSLPVLVQPIDSTPPAVPRGLRAYIDTLGAVHLEWQPNADPDLLGYRLYRSHAHGQPLVVMNDTAIRSTHFVDSIQLNNLNHKMLYAIAALDQRYNQSALSAMVEVLKPNTIPPPPPLIVRGTAADNANTIAWAMAADPYLAGFEVWRQADNAEPELIARLTNPADTAYTDRQIKPATRYTYWLVAYSTGGLRSPQSVPYALTTAMATAKKSAARLHLDALRQGIAIRWSTTLDSPTIYLYKLDASGTRRLYREGLPAKGEILDTDVLLGQPNHYMLLVKSKGHKPITITKSIEI